jgi:Spy/CpxP family protein refolding chaperone
MLSIVNVKGISRNHALTPEQWKQFTDLMKRNRKPNAAPPADGRPSRSLESMPAATNSP